MAWGGGGGGSMMLELRQVTAGYGLAPALHGDIHWIADDSTTAPGPVVPPPAGLWAPAEGVTPATGSYVYLESEPDDYIGAGIAQRLSATLQQLLPWTFCSGPIFDLGMMRSGFVEDVGFLLFH